ncbi:MAG: hypothetical protein U0797_05115 [Gemmataceae bacterium]
MGLTDESLLELAGRLTARDGAPDARLEQHERRALVREALTRLGERDREGLVLRHLEDLSSRRPPWC